MSASAPPAPSTATLSQRELNDLILQYETFIDEKLKVDLQKIEALRDRLYAQTAELEQLKNCLLTIRDTTAATATKPALSSGGTAASSSGTNAAARATPSFKTMVDLGCNYYVQAEVPDASRVFVKVGFGFFVEMTIAEALVFIDKKVDLLNKKTDGLTKDSTFVKARIKLILRSLQDLQAMSASGVADLSL